MKLFTRSVLVSSLFAVAAASQALVINVSAAGTWSNQANPFYSTTERVLFQSSDLALPALTSLYWEIPVYNGGATAGNGYITNGVDTLSFSSVHDSSQIQQSGGTQSLAGTWTFTGGTGAFASYTGGAGTFSHTLNLQNPQSAMFAFAGELEAVPEPASMAALAIGVAAMARRRRQS